jgi:hypothetical protein
VYIIRAEEGRRLLSAARAAGFSACIVVDYPHSNAARKFSLCLMHGSARGNTLPPDALEHAATTGPAGLTSSPMHRHHSAAAKDEGGGSDRSCVSSDEQPQALKDEQTQTLKDEQPQALSLLPLDAAPECPLAW